MARVNTVRLSDKERELLEQVREKEFGTNSVPLGEALDVACSNYLND